MGRQPSARSLALMDRIVAALGEGPAAAKEVAVRVGTVPCYCLRGYSHSGCAGCAETPGWMKANLSDVRPHLERAVRLGLAGRDTMLDGRVIYSRVHAPIELAEI